MLKVHSSSMKIAVENAGKIKLVAAPEISLESIRHKRMLEGARFRDMQLVASYQADFLGFSRMSGSMTFNDPAVEA